MPKLTGEAALPKNLAASLILTTIVVILGKQFGWITKPLSIPLPLALIMLIATLLALYFTAKHRLERVIIRTVYWFWEMQRIQERLKPSINQTAPKPNNMQTPETINHSSKQKNQK